MPHSTPMRPCVTATQWQATQWVARALMVTLAYLIAHVLAQPQPSWLEIATIPALWAVTPSTKGSDDARRASPMRLSDPSDKNASSGQGIRGFGWK